MAYAMQVPLRRQNPKHKIIRDELYRKAWMLPDNVHMFEVFWHNPDSDREIFKGRYHWFEIKIIHYYEGVIELQHNIAQKPDWKRLLDMAQDMADSKYTMERLMREARTADRIRTWKQNKQAGGNI